MLLETFSTSLRKVLLYIRINLKVDFPRGTQLVTCNVLTRMVKNRCGPLCAVETNTTTTITIKKKKLIGRETPCLLTGKRALASK